MPELPDVEAFRQVLASCARGRRIRRVEVRDAGVLHGVSARRLADVRVRALAPDGVDPRHLDRLRAVSAGPRSAGVLVRPDGVIAWRAEPGTDAGAAVAALRRAARAAG